MEYRVMDDMDENPEKKTKKQRKQYDSVPSSNLEEYDHLMSVVRGGDDRPVCRLGHKMFRYFPSDNNEGGDIENDCEKYYVTSYTCDMCTRRFCGGQCSGAKGGDATAERWSCVVCHAYDTCFVCHPDTNTSKKSEIGAISFARRHLVAAGRDEADGIPVGAWVVPKQFAGTVRNDWSRAGIPAATAGSPRPTVGPLGKIGFKKVQEVPGDPRYFVLLLSTNSAQMVSAGVLASGAQAQSLTEGVLSSADEAALVASFLAEHPYLEYYPGVRLFDPLLSCGTPSAAQYRNNRVSQSDNKKEFRFSRINADGTPAHTAALSGGDRFRFAEIFAGIGGFRLGLDAVGGQCVFAAEINEDARHTYAVNFPGCAGEPEVMRHDVTEHYGKCMPSFDVLTAGFPCQSFSNRGEQKGLDDPRGQLYLELLRILRARQPASFLFENVARLVTIDGGRRSSCNTDPLDPLGGCVVGATFALMLERFAACGYAVTWRVLNSRHWLPQMRERVYIVGIRTDLVARDPGGRGINDLFSWAGVQARAGDRINSTVREILQTPEEISTPALFRSTLTGETIRYAPECDLLPAQWARASSVEFEQKSNRYPGRCAEGQERLIQLDGKTPTLNSGYRNVASFSTKYVGEERDGRVRELPRFLSPRECCRVQGFPDNFEIPLCNLAQCGRFYVQIGNAVCPPVIQSIGEQMLLLLEKLGFRGQEEGESAEKL